MHPHAFNKAANTLSACFSATLDSVLSYKASAQDASVSEERIDSIRL
jgi:hypothetical protein